MRRKKDKLKIVVAVVVGYKMTHYKMLEDSFKPGHWREIVSSVFPIFPRREQRPRQQRGQKPPRESARTAFYGFLADDRTHWLENLFLAEIPLNF